MISLYFEFSKFFVGIQIGLIEMKYKIQKTPIILNFIRLSLRRDELAFFIENRRSFSSTNFMRCFTKSEVRVRFAPSPTGTNRTILAFKRNCISPPPLEYDFFLPLKFLLYFKHCLFFFA